MVGIGEENKVEVWRRGSVREDGEWRGGGGQGGKEGGCGGWGREYSRSVEEGKRERGGGVEKRDGGCGVGRNRGVGW